MGPLPKKLPSYVPDSLCIGGLLEITKCARSGMEKKRVNPAKSASKAKAYFAIGSLLLSNLVRETLKFKKFLEQQGKS